MKFLHSLAAASFLLLAPSSFAADAPLPPGVTKITSVEGITEYALPNGLRILLAPDASKPTTTYNTTYIVGSRMEGYGETGMAHLLEHLMFKGTPKYPGAMMEMSKRGLRFNGSTWTDRTNYFASWAANDATLDWYVRWSADAMTHSFIARKDLDSEMTVVRNEMERNENDPIRSLVEKAMAVSYQWHSYGKSTIGARADVENVSIDHLQAFYRKYYQPDNAVVILTGKFDEAKALKLIADAYRGIPKPARKLEPTYTIDPVQEGERSITLRRVGDTQLAMAMYHVPAASTADYAAIDLLVTIMGDTPAGRLHKTLVETKQAASVFGFPFAFRDPTLVLFLAQLPNDASLDTARQTLLATLESTAKQPITAEEVERARTKYLKNFELTAADPEKVGVALSEAIALGDWRLFFLKRDRIRTIKAEDVQRVASSYFIPDNRTLGLFIPTAQPHRAPAPALVDVAPMVKGYKGDAAIAQGEVFDATPQNIDSRTQRAQLPGGMKVALLPKRTRGATVNARLVLHFGDEQSLMGTPPVGGVTGYLLNRGAGGLTRQQIQDEFDKLKARVSFTGNAADVVVAIETTKENLPAVLKLVATVLRKPAFDATELDILKNEFTTAIESQRKEPNAVARNAIARHSNPYPHGHVRYEETFDESIAEVKAVTPEQVKKFYADFYGADHAEFAAVGDFDAEAVKALLTQLFGDWKSAKAYKRVPNPSYVLTPTNLRFETPDKANAFFIAQLRFPLQDTSPDYAALLLANYAVGGDPASILWKRVREKDGLSYGVGSGLNASQYEPSATWTVSAIYAPQNVTRLEQAVREEVARVMGTGITAAEIKDAKNGLLQARRLQRAQDSYLATTLGSKAEIDRTMAFDAKVDRDIEAATVEQVNAAFRKYIDPAKIVFVYAGDFAKAAK